jgi:hypothetical protein
MALLSTSVLDNMLRGESGFSTSLMTKGVDRMKRTPAAVASVLKVQRAALRDVDANGWLSNEGKEQTRKVINEWGRAQIDTLNTIFDGEANSVLRQLPPTADAQTPEQRAAFEAKAPRLWERVRGQLDAGVDLVTVVKNADRDTLQVVEEEISGYMLSRHVADERMAQTETEAARALINQHRPTVLSPDEAKRFSERGDIEAGIGNVAGAFNWARAALEDSSIQHLPAFGRGESVTVNE